MQRTKEVQVSKITTKNAILKRRLADRNLSPIRSVVVMVSLKSKRKLEVTVRMTNLWSAFINGLQ